MCQNVFIEIGISLLEWSLGHTSYSLKLLLRGPNLALSFLGHSHSKWKFQGQGLNPCHRSNQSHSSDYARSLTH